MSSSAVMSQSATPGSRSSSTAPAVEMGGGPTYKKLPKEDIDNLLEYLGIDTTLPLGLSTIRTAFQKHLAIVASEEKVLQLRRDAAWQDLSPDWTPNLKEFIEIFVAKSQYYGTWEKSFEKAVEYPDMLDWLNLEEDRKSDKWVWGHTKSHYAIEDLKVWLKKQERQKQIMERLRDDEKEEEEEKKSKKSKKKSKDKDKDKRAKK